MENEAMSETAKWHWAEGMKYALEGMKTLFILNGAAAVSILTFIGNVKSKSEFLIFAMLAFALGAASVIFTMLLAYLTQLHYGNANHSISSNDLASTWNTGVRYHYGVYVFMALGAVFFILGAVLAAIGLTAANFTPKCSLS